MSEHSKTPWRVHTPGDLTEIRAEGQIRVVDWTGFDSSDRPLSEHRANARLIVRAVNNHAALLAACKAAHFVLSGNEMSKSSLEDALRNCQEAIAAAEPK